MFWVYFQDLCVQKQRCLLWSSVAFWKFSTCKAYRKSFWVHFHNLCVQKQSFLLWSSDACCKFSACKVSQKMFWVHFQEHCIKKRSCLLWSSDTVWTFLPCKVYLKCSGRIFTIYMSKNEAVSCEFRCILKVLGLQRLLKMFWVQFEELCVQKRFME